MWTNAQHHDRPAEYSWRPLFNAAVWLTPTTRVQWQDAKPVEICKLARPNRSQPLVAEICWATCPHHIVRMWGKHCCLTIFFRLSIRSLVAKI